MTAGGKQCLFLFDGLTGPVGDVASVRPGRTKKAFGKGHFGADAAKHEQEICTPRWLLGVAQKAFGGVIMLDPCAASGGVATHVGGVTQATRIATVNVPKPQKPGDPDGLVVPWVDGTYVNPPYVDLDRWCAKVAREIAPRKRILLLCPVRTHRLWLPAVCSRADDIVCLRPFAFEGSVSTFPVPMCLVGFGTGDLDVPRRRMTCHMALSLPPENDQMDLLEETG